MTKGRLQSRISAQQRAHFEVFHPVFRFRAHLTTLYGDNTQDFKSFENIICSLSIPTINLVFCNRGKASPFGPVMKMTDSKILFYDMMIQTFVLSYLTVAPKVLRSWLESMPLWLGRKLHIPKVIKREIGYNGNTLFTEHHEAHAASAFYPSPFNDAAILTIETFELMV